MKGFDLPELKIAAFHDIRKTLAVTLQLAGRFTRSRPDLGDATFIANTADVTVREELRKLYSREPDWNVLLPQLSDTMIGEQQSMQEFLQGFTNFVDEIPLRTVRPARELDPIRWTSFQRGIRWPPWQTARARRTRRSFTDDYKTGAVRLVLDEGKTVAAAARDLGLTESSLRNWVEQARADRTKGKTGLTTEERTELAALRKDNRELRMERDILKKAAAFFARNQA